MDSSGPSRPSAALPERRGARLGAQRDLDELRDLTRAFLARAADGNAEEIERFRGQRGALIARVSPLDLEGAARTGAGRDLLALRDTLREVLALDQQLLAVLEASTVRTRDALQQLQRARQALRSYRGTGPLSPAYLEAEG